MRFIFSLAFILISILNYGQVDYPYIKSRITDSSSSAYYPTLTQRFEDSDTTLTEEDFYLLYYGAVYLPSYDTAKILDIEREIRLANYDGEYLEAYELANDLLNIYPASIQAYFEKAYACYNLKRFEEEAYNKKRYKVLIRTVLSRGNGKSFESPYYVNLHNDEFEIIKYLQLESKEEMEVEYRGKSFDVFTLKPNKSKIKHLYFTITNPSK